MHFRWELLIEWQPGAQKTTCSIEGFTAGWIETVGHSIKIESFTQILLILKLLMHSKHIQKCYEITNTSRPQIAHRSRDPARARRDRGSTAWFRSSRCDDWKGTSRRRTITGHVNIVRSIFEERKASYLKNEKFERIFSSRKYEIQPKSTVFLGRTRMMINCSRNWWTFTAA